MRNILSGFLLAIPFWCYSQTDFRKGYIITQNKDTLTGYINYREDNRLFRHCDYREFLHNSTITYSPDQLIGYGFEKDKYFESRLIEKKDQTREDLFLEVLVRGLVSLYKLDETFWVEKEGQQITELIIERRETEINGKRGIINTNAHIATLNILMNDCAELRNDIQNIKLNERSLTNLIGNYNQCKGATSITFKAEKPWFKATFGILAGINISNLSFDVFSTSYEHLEGPFETWISPTAGLNFNLSSPRLNERISFIGAIDYFSSKYYNYNMIVNGFTTKINYISIELDQINFPIGFQYTFPEKRITPFLQAGVSTTFNLNTSSSWIQEVESNNVVETYNQEALSISSNQIGFWGSLGIMKSLNNRLSVCIELRYEKTNGLANISTSSELNSKISNLQLIISLRTK